MLLQSMYESPGYLGRTISNTDLTVLPDPWLHFQLSVTKTQDIYVALFPKYNNIVRC